MKLLIKNKIIIEIIVAADWKPELLLPCKVS